MSITIRPAIEADCAALAAIDQLSNPSPWPEQNFRAALLNRHESVLLAEHRQQTVGFIVWHSLFEESELHLIATTPACRRQGIGSALLACWLKTGAEQGANRFLLEVRAGNQAAQSLYQQHGFAASGRRQAYYALPDGSREDALIMEKTC